jgi:RNA polymerase sigma factor for flagellar operon FliA
MNSADTSKRDRLVIEHLPLVRSISGRLRRILPPYVDEDDLIHAGILGLFDAALKYNPRKGVKFESYAHYRIKGAMLDSLRDLDWASRTLRKHHKKLQRIKDEISNTMSHNPTERELAAGMGMDLPSWRRTAIELRVAGPISGSSWPLESRNEAGPEFPAGDDMNPEVLTGRQQLSSLLNAALKTLPDRAQAIMLLYYAGEKTMWEIGHVMGVSGQRVDQIRRAGLRRMARSLRSVGIRAIASVL